MADRLRKPSFWKWLWLACATWFALSAIYAWATGSDRALTYMALAVAYVAMLRTEEADRG